MTTDTVTNTLAPGIAAPSPALAAAKLEQLTKNQEWGARFLAGDVAAKKEFHDLTAQIATGDPTADALANRDNTAIATTVDGELPPGVLRAAVADLQIRGLSDQAIAEIMNGKTFSHEEVRAAEQWRERATRDPVFRAALLRGDPDCGRQMLVANAIIAAGTGEP
jgi:hypothetical protein